MTKQRLTMLFLSRLRRMGCSCLGRDPVQFIMCNDPGHQQRSGMAMYLGRFIATAPSVSQYHVHVFLHAKHQAKPTPPNSVLVCSRMQTQGPINLALDSTKGGPRCPPTVLAFGERINSGFYTSLASSEQPGLFFIAQVAFSCSTWIRWTCATNEAHMRLTPPCIVHAVGNHLGPD